MRRTLPAALMGMFLFGILCLVPAADRSVRADDKKPSQPDLSEYRTVDKAITTQISKAAPAGPSQTSYLGVHLKPNDKGKLVVADLEDESPAAKAGMQRGDLVVKIADKPVENLDAFRELVQTKAPGEHLTLQVLRQDKPVDLTATLAATSRPMTVVPEKRAVLGITVAATKEGDGLAITEVYSDPAQKAKLKVGEVIRKLDGTAVKDTAKFRELMTPKKPNDTVTLTLFLAEKEVDVKVTLGEEQVVAGGAGRNWDNRVGNYWTKDVYRLGLVCIEYPDVKHNAKIAAKDWEDSLFSKGTFKDKKNATGQNVYGSLNDYYLEQSYGAIHVEGKVFDWVEVGKKRMDYEQNTGNAKTSSLSEAMDKVIARDGKDAFKDLDGIFFIYAGSRVNTTRDRLYWPHRANMQHDGKRWSYFITSELAGGGGGGFGRGGGGGRGGADAQPAEPRMENISVMCHEFGHMLGLPDLYARPENPGSEGLGVWCAMSNQLGNGRPQHFSLWCKEKLGWAKPIVIDPTVKQKLILSPIEDSGKECIKILVKQDGSEYYLLENKKKKGFDQDLPGEGLLVWRVVNNHPILEESHGVEGPSGPGVFLNAVPFPSKSNNAFTPFTTPSSRSQLGGGYAVHLTNIRRLDDGRVTFYVGYEYE